MGIASPNRGVFAPGVCRPPGIGGRNSGAGVDMSCVFVSKAKALAGAAIV